MPHDKALATDPSINRAPIRYARGKSKTDNNPVVMVAPTWEAFANALLADTAPTKGMQWICGPVGMAPDDAKHAGRVPDIVGRRHRCKDCVQPRRWVAHDIDGGLPSGAKMSWKAAVAEMFYGLSYVAHTTASHTPAKPRIRVLVELDREVDRDEGIRVSRSLRARADTRTALLSEPCEVKWDAGMDNAENPLFTPLAVGTEVLRGRGFPACVDALLVGTSPTEDRPRREMSPEQLAARADALSMETPPGALLHLQQCAHRVIEAERGDRNGMLFRATKDAAKIDALTDDEIEEAMIAAGLDAGLTPGETHATVRSGLLSGRIEEPVPIPEDEFKPLPDEPEEVDDFEVPAPAESPRPQIRWEPGELSKVVARAELALRNRERGIYVRGTTLVRAHASSTGDASEAGETWSTDDQLRRPEGAVSLSIVERVDLQLDLEESATWWKWYQSPAPGEWRRIGAPVLLADAVLAHKRARVLPQLVGLSLVPILLGDGRVVARPGYDPTTRLLLALPPEWPAPLEEPTRADAEAALARLRELVGTFPWATPEDESVGIATMMTAVLRASMDRAPMTVYTAPTAGTGKSKLAHVAAVLATGTAGRAIEWSRNDEENTKVLTGALLQGEPVILLDNLDVGLRGSLLCSALTEPEVSLRVLGSTGQHPTPCRSLILGTGNGVVIDGDLTRRVMRCTLNAGMEHPERRHFDTDPVREAAARREELVNDVLTIARARIRLHDGRSGLWSSYGQWGYLVRDSLTWLGMPDPVLVTERAADEDPEREMLTTVLESWRAYFGTGPVTASELIDRGNRATREGIPPGAEKDGELREEAAERLHEAWRSIGGGRPLTTKALGKWLSRYKDRPVRGMEIRRGAQSYGVRLWHLKVRQPE